MDQMTIEEHKQMMIGETIPLLEGNSVSPNDTEFFFETRKDGDAVVIEMTAYVNGQHYVKKSRKVEQLNG